MANTIIHAIGGTDCCCTGWTDAWIPGWLEPAREVAPPKPKTKPAWLLSAERQIAKAFGIPT